MWKKMTAVVLAVLTLCQLTACGASSADDTGITEDAKTEVESETQTESIAQDGRIWRTWKKR